MKHKMINNQMFEMLEVIIFDEFNEHYIVRQSDEAFLYPGIGNYTFNIEDLENLENELCGVSSKNWVDKKFTKVRIQYYEKVIGILRKYNRNVIIDELITGKKRDSLEGFNPLVFAC